MENLGIIGVGKIGEAIITGLSNSALAKNYAIHGTTRSEESAKMVAKKYSIDCQTSNMKLAQTAKLLFLAVKPHQAKLVLNEMSKSLTSSHVLVSLCASVPIANLKEWSGGQCKVIRAMPNTPALVGEGMTVLCPETGTPEKIISAVNAIFATLGRTALLEEHLMDGATGLSGCGPAYMFLVIEALSEAGVKVGISRKLSTLLAAQTMLGAAKMVLARDQMHPAAMKDEVTTPAGCTIDGLMALEEGKLRVALIKAVLAATNRSKNLKIG